MSLTTGRGPLSGTPAGRFNQPIPEGIVYVEPHRRRVRAVTGGRTVVDSERSVLVHRPGRPPTYAFPPEDVASDLGRADPAAPGRVEVPWDSVDAWYEEDEQVFGHPRNPYHRIDCLPTGRRLRVEVGGQVLVDGPADIVLYETALEPRLYIAPGAVRMDLLVASATRTYCPYKGTASYWSATIAKHTFPDVAWTYADPLAESTAIAGLLAFEPTRAEVAADIPPPAF